MHPSAHTGALDQIEIVFPSSGGDDHTSDLGDAASAVRLSRLKAGTTPPPDRSIGSSPPRRLNDCAAVSTRADTVVRGPGWLWVAAAAYLRGQVNDEGVSIRHGDR